MNRDHPSTADPSSSVPPTAHEDDLGIEELLREVGARAEPNAELTNEVRAAVYAQWQAVVQRRERRRRGVVFALAAGLIGLVAVSVVALRIDQQQQAKLAPQPVARLVRIEGHPQIEVAGRLHEAALGEVLSTGMSLTTLDSSVALSFGEGTNALSLRVDTGTQLRFSKLNSIDLQAGALYVDAGDSGQSVPLTVQTSAGKVRHVGTQYQVRMVNGSTPGIEVSVREGRVEIVSHFGTNTGSAGERVAVSIAGSVSRSALPANDPSWRWASRVAPPFDIAGRPLSSFLEWVARETGRQLSYDSPTAQQAAANAQMHGSIANVPLEMAIPAVVSTTSKVKIAELSESSLRITLKRD